MRDRSAGVETRPAAADRGVKGTNRRCDTVFVTIIRPTGCSLSERLLWRSHMP